MNLDRLTFGEKLAGGSAVVLFVSMFLDWFVVRIPESLGVNFVVDGTGQSAWGALDYIPIVLTITIVTALVVAVLRLIGVTGELSVAANRGIAALGTVSVLLIVFRIIDPPSFGSFEGIFGRTAAAERTVEFGIFVGLLAAAGIAIGGYLAMKDEGSSSSVAAPVEADVKRERVRGSKPDGW